MNNASPSNPLFYGWRIAAASFFTLGLAIGLPYYGMTFFYDYFERPLSEGGLGWTRSTITFGLPIGTLATLWVGPLVAHRFPPRRTILMGTGLTALVLIGFGRMNGAVSIYYGLWLLYMVGNVFSGVLSHQVLLSHWFVRQRGLALSIAYLGISFVGALSVRFVAQPLTREYGFRGALQLMGCLLFLTWPIVLFIMRERPAEMGLQPDGESWQPGAVSEEAPPPASLQMILRDRIFWVLLIGGTCTTGAIGVISQHLKLILKDRGETGQELLDQTFSQTLLVLLIVSAVGRLLIGRLSDRLPKRHVLTLAFLPLAASIPLLFFVQPPDTPYLFSVLYGLATGADFLLIALLAADLFGISTLVRVLAIILPVMTVGQTWAPYLIALLRERTGDYTLPLAITFLLAVVGRGVLSLLPPPAGWGPATTETD
ncbi:MAG: MFS transporter [Blastocatellia bacterium]|nr:MFS transporter [Blastocatellia bacterium]